jgi:hypothetical protein
MTYLNQRRHYWCGCSAVSSTLRMRPHGQNWCAPAHRQASWLHQVCENKQAR